MQKIHIFCKILSFLFSVQLDLKVARFHATIDENFSKNFLKKKFRWFAKLTFFRFRWRGNSKNRPHIDSPQWKSRIGALFIRSYERGERVHLAMLSRGYNGTIIDLYKPVVTNKDWRTAMALPIVAASIMVVAWITL